MADSAINPTILNQSVPVPDEAYANPYLEKQACYEVNNWVLRLVVFALAGLNVTQCVALWKLVNREPERIVVRVDQNGDTAVAPYTSLQFQPREAESKHFLMNFVTAHYSRIRATRQDDFERSLYFLPSNQVDFLIKQEERDKTIPTFRISNDPEVDIFITNVVIDDMRKSPYKATVVFDKVFRAYQGGEIKRETYTASFVYSFMDKVPQKFLKVNPLGLIINYFREDQAFIEAK